MTKAKIAEPSTYLSADVRVLGWDEMRSIVRRSGCTATEERVGLITKRFTVSGARTAMGSFIHMAIDSDVFGESVLRELEAL